MSEVRQPTFRLQWRKRIQSLRNIPPVLRIIWASGPGYIAGSLTLRLAAGLLPLAMLAVARRIIDGVAGVYAGRALPSDFWFWVGLEFALALLGAVLGRWNGYLESVVADRFSHHLSIRIMEHASRLDLASYEDAEFQDKLDRARVQATDRVGMVIAVASLIQQIIAAAGFCAGILWFSPWLLAVLVLCLIPALLGESHFAFLGYSLSFQQTPVRRQIDYLRLLGASRESAKEVKLFGLAPFLTGRFRELSTEIYSQNIALGKKRLLLGAFFSLITTSGYYGAYVYVVYRAAIGDISVGTLTFLTGVIAGANASIQSIFSTFSSIADQSLFLTDLLTFFAVKPSVASKPNALPAPRPIRNGFVFENVSFNYPGSARAVLNSLDLHFSPGERIALVGENGQGKTTLVKLLTRLYDPTSGRILLDGVDLRDYDIESLCREIGVIFQDFMRYDMTAKENIEVGDIDRNDAGRGRAVREAADKSGAAPVIARLPNGLDQLLGRRFDGGVDLSGGEWQKVALARAYLRDAQVLVLDEPTASLDARSEFEVFERFAQLTQDKMALLISHRFSTVRMADRILVLEEGRIVEEGSHARLLDRGGRYSSMFELQAASYR